MIHNQFKIGGIFYTATGTWLCTDIGTRVIVAIHVGHEDWMKGPPYAVPEIVFDEYDFPGCSL